MICHIVLWTLHDPADAPRFKADLDSCRGLVDGMAAFEVAIRTPELDSNCDVVLYSRFRDKAALDAYINHPHHQAVAAGVAALRKSRHSLDYPLQETTP